MAWLEQTPNGYFHVSFRYAGQRFKKSLRTKDERDATARLHRIDENIRLVESGRLVPPDDADLGSFLLSDGRLNGRNIERPKKRLRRLSDFALAFLAAVPPGSLEESTVAGMRTHLGHLKRSLGATFDLPCIELGDLQTYIEKRGKERGLHGATLSPATIKKELTTLRTMWNWARNAGHLSRPLPIKGLRYPKSKDKPPFQTLDCIERRVARGDLTEEQEHEFWQSLFFTSSEIQELLRHVRNTARHPFLYPMFTFAAHTGARRSEILRSHLVDLDFAAGIITIREKKRVRGRLTNRTVPMSPLLRRALREWLPFHPGGELSFRLEPELERSRKTRRTEAAITRSEAHDHFKRALVGTRFEKASGWHVLRHSFCSNAAAAGIEQRVINQWVGHQTEEMVKRYRHLIPEQQQRAIEQVFPDLMSRR
ncbi:MAG: site-specific integrase [Pirellulales bacterium]|nr:site-specific integrase [Pirellulales bacterium]